MRKLAALISFALALSLRACTVPVPPTPTSHLVAISWSVQASGIPRLGLGNLPLIAGFALPRPQSIEVFNIYRAPCAAVTPVAGSIPGAGICQSEGAFAKIGQTSALQYVDQQVTGGFSYSYYVTGLQVGVETAESNHVAATVPGN